MDIFNNIALIRKTIAITLLGISQIFWTCNKHSDIDNEIKEQIGLYYLKSSTAVGGGSWHIHNIDLISKEQTTPKNWTVKAIINGIYSSPPLGNPIPDSKFRDTAVFHFKIDTEGNWICNEL